MDFHPSMYIESLSRPLIDTLVSAGMVFSANQIINAAFKKVRQDHQRFQFWLALSPFVFGDDAFRQAAKLGHDTAGNSSPLSHFLKSVGKFVHIIPFFGDS
jgi:hypothetical protein